MTINFLIIDDEYYICEGIRTMIMTFGIPELGEIRTCYSGEEALSICRTFKPQIVLTDIKMSGINGIELIKLLSKTLYPVRFLVLSGYDDYEYVRNAFQNGAVDYLLKPVISEQLKKLIEKQCQLLRTDFQERMISLSRHLFAAAIQPEYRFCSSHAKEIQTYLPYSNYMFSVIACSKDHTETAAYIIELIYDYCACHTAGPFLCSDITEKKTALLLNYPQHAPDLAPLWDMLLNRTETSDNTELAIGISRTGNLASVYSLYYEAENRLTFRLLEGYGKLYASDPPTPGRKQSGKIKQIISNLLKSPELLYSSNLWDQLCTQLHRLNITDLKHFYNYFTGLLRSNPADCGNVEYIEHLPSFYDFSSYAELEEFLHRQLQTYASYCPKELKNQSNIENIKEYVDKNFTSHITLKEVADLHFISASHLSKLFHEKYNMSFQAYLTFCRMTYAENLLHDPLLSIQEIAAMTGYENAFNFSRAFKNYFGISPSHHRRQDS